MATGSPCSNYLPDDNCETYGQRPPCYWCGWELAWHLDKNADLEFPLTYWETKFLTVDDDDQ